MHFFVANCFHIYPEIDIESNFKMELSITCQNSRKIKGIYFFKMKSGTLFLNFIYPD